MTEPADGLRALLEVPASLPEPVEALQRRAAVRRRRRIRGRTAFAAVAAAVAAGVVAPLLDRPSDAPTQVVAGPDANSTTTSTAAALEFVPGQPLRTRLDVTVPAGWETLFADGHRLVVATRPLSDRDRELALLARSDASFSTFPPDAVVVAVGWDLTEAVTGTNWDGTPIDHGPAYALGPERALPGGVRFRGGDIPQNLARIASYAGPAAPANRLAEVDAVIAGLRLVRTGDPSVRPPPPPEGSTMALPGGPLPVAERGLPEVVRASTATQSLVVAAGSDCGYLRPAGSQPELPSQHVAAGCGERPTGSGIEVIGTVASLRGAPGAPPSTAVILRAGPGVATVSARTADGKLVAAVLGREGWGVALSEGRIVGLSAFDATGRQVAEAFVK